MPTKYGSLPFKEAIKFFRSKELVETERWSDVWKQQHDVGFMVAGATKADILEDFHQSLLTIQKNGGTLRDFQKDFNSIASKHGWGYNGGSKWRSRVIFDTNMRQAYNAGREVQMANPALRKRRPYGIYIHGDSVNPRAEHLRWHNYAVPLDHPWWETHTPINGFGCSCKKVMANERDLKRRGITPLNNPPSDGTYKHIDSETGEESIIPKGISPGFDYRPGASVVDRMRGVVKKKAKRLPKPLNKSLNQHADNIPAAPAAPGVVKTETFSTIKGIDEIAVNKLLNAIPNAQPQLEKLGRFLEAHPVKTLLLKVGEMSAGSKASRKIYNAVQQFLGSEKNPQGYAKRRASQTNGFTAYSINHVIIKVKAKDKLNKFNPEQLNQAVEHAITAHSNGGMWSIRASLDELTDGKQPGIISTLVHEIGHQVHFWAGTPNRPKGVTQTLTHYSKTNVYEWHAEHFTAWLLNRDALAKWQPDIAKYFDELLESAIKSDRKAK